MVMRYRRRFIRKRRYSKRLFRKYKKSSSTVNRWAKYNKRYAVNAQNPKLSYVVGKVGKVSPRISKFRLLKKLGSVERAVARHNGNYEPGKFYPGVTKYKRFVNQVNRRATYADMDARGVLGIKPMAYRQWVRAQNDRRAEE